MKLRPIALQRLIDLLFVFGMFGEALLFTALSSLVTTPGVSLN